MPISRRKFFAKKIEQRIIEYNERMEQQFAASGLSSNKTNFSMKDMTNPEKIDFKMGNKKKSKKP